MSKLSIESKNVRFPVAPDLYGLFFEDINRAGDSGLYPEMLRNRSFEDSIPPERCTLSEDGSVFTTPMGWSDQFNGGEGLAKWLDGVPPTPVPAWYADSAVMTLDESERLNEKRLVGMKVDFSPGGAVRNIGYRGVPLKSGNTYHFYMFAKAENVPITLNAAIVSKDGTIQDETVFTVTPGQYERYDCTFTAVADDFDGEFVFTSPEKATVCFGFVSLMPADTYKGHGMRKDLMELLEGVNAKFLRFPGGCIVEGFTYETAMRFPNTIGPVWERPSHTLMWHYRTTNGLGFHEYLQICEDLNLEPMYVINCGLTCQGREPEFFEGEELEQLLQEALDAIEYATGDSSTPMGKLRTEMGHPEPFRMSYIEIGNENAGDEYNWRYKKFYDVLKAKHPQIKYISNTHTELDGLPTEIADEHYYNTPEFFAENTHFYDDYDRTGPEIFLGEYAVTVGAVTASLYSALAEAMFLLGVENNQDIVTTSAYAPLFQNVGYTAWYPNLIAFDNHRSYGIPTYHMLSMLGGNRGKEVVKLNVETEKLHRDIAGLPGIFSPKGGLFFRNATVNGKPVSVSNEVQGRFTQNGNECRADSAPPARTGYVFPGADAIDNVVFATLGNNAETCYTYEVEAKTSESDSITLTVWCHRPFSVFRIDETQDPDELNIDSIRCFEWTLNGTASTVSEFYYKRHHPIGKEVPVSVNLKEYNAFKIITREDGFDCYINGTLVHEAYLPKYPAVAATAATDDDGIIVKAVNITEAEEAIEISLDCAVQPDYEVELLTATDRDEVNTLDAPNTVVPAIKTLTGAGKTFTYSAPAYSLSILKLKK